MYKIIIKVCETLVTTKMKMIHLRSFTISQFSPMLSDALTLAICTSIK